MLKMHHIIMISLIVGFSLIIIGFINILLAVIFMLISDLIWLIFIWRYKDFEISMIEITNSYVILSSVYVFILSSLIRVPSIIFFLFPLEKASIFILSSGLLIVEGQQLEKFGFSLVKLDIQLVLGFLWGFFIAVLPTIMYFLLMFLYAGTVILIKVDIIYFLITFPFYLAVGLGEEALFRAYIERRAVITMGYKKGIIWAAILFGLWHAYWHMLPFDFFNMLFHVFFSFMFGILFGIIYENTNSMIIIILIHAIWDTVVSVTTFPVVTMTEISMYILSMIISFVMIFLASIFLSKKIGKII